MYDKECVEVYEPNRYKPKSDLLLDYEDRIYSQYGEDGVIHEIFKRIGTTNKYYVEFGVEDGFECNARLLREFYDWDGIMMDGGSSKPQIKLY